MNVKQLITKLLDCDMSAEVYSDTNDSVKEQNYQAVTYIEQRQNMFGENFVVIDADWGKK